jgi:OmcA/MtrC family decaheme c-type cytochrome
MNKRFSHRCIGFIAAGLLAATLAGCGGDDSTGPQGVAGPPGADGAPGPAGPPGATGTVNAPFITPQEWEASQFSATVDSVDTSGKPVVEFTVVDERGRPVEGLETLTSKAAGTTIATYPNISFAIAKLMPRTDARPASWVSYIVTSVNTTTAALSATRPSTDNQGTLVAVAGRAGSYKYTFFRDVPGTKAVIDGLTYSGNNRKEDLGDLTWQPDLPHRLTIQISGAAPGTGSNTPTGVQTAPAVNMANPVNLAYDFVPATGKPLTAVELSREDVSIDNCNVCHGKLAIHGGNEAQGIPNQRVEVRYCVVCHTDQRAFGRAQVASTRDTTTNGFDSITFPKLTETATKNTVTGITSFSYTPDTYVADGEVSGNFTTMIHKIHQGHTLVKQNYHYAGLAFNLKGFSKLGEGQKMCTTCHGGADATTANNFNQIPSRKSCGACHDGIKWDTGSGSTLGDKMKVVYAADTLPSTGHLGGAYQDDGACKSCHTAEGIQISHRTENITKNNPQITDGLATFRYEIKSATMSGEDLVVEFGIWKKVSPASTEALVTFVAPAASFPALAPNVAGGPLQPDFSGSASFLLPYALSQDGITTPTDYNNAGRAQAQPRSVSITTCLTTGSSGTCTVVPSTNGYYRATIKAAYPTGALMRAVALQGYFSQVTAPASLAAPNGRHAISVIFPVNKDAVRRTVVDSNKCAGCHEWFEGHGGNRVYEIQVCAACHVPGMASSGRGVPDSLMNTWPFTIADEKILKDWGFDKTLPNAALKLPVTSNNLKEMIHGIHIGRARETPRTFQSARDATSRSVVQLLDFRRLDFPGKINNCETCHVTYTGASSGAGSVQTYAFIPKGALATTFESIDQAYADATAANTATPADASRSLKTHNRTDTVRTPWAGACLSCHESDTARAHVAINGGFVDVTRATAQPTPRPLEDIESCAVCHGPGRTFDTATIHK